MQKRNFKDAMREMSEHVVTKIRNYTEELIRRNKGDDDMLRMGSIGMDMDHPRTILYVILHKLVQDDFKPRNDKYEHIMIRKHATTGTDMMLISGSTIGMI